MTIDPTDRPTDLYAMDLRSRTSAEKSSVSVLTAHSQ